MGTKLYSNANGAIDYSIRQYRLDIQMDGNLVLSAFRFGSRGYWNSETVGNQKPSLTSSSSSAFTDDVVLNQIVAPTSSSSFTSDVVVFKLHNPVAPSSSC
ncbi:hypothetical protein Ddye_021453 [Dipteronia dyeriana]|uniref:Uncharacterized protein n=1 Tax=Dipteronia dyeriana TaxID=168575 RepID=A0AAD9U243_9ROSI|nr:hypothetical protein Ddye_021453 [Dipteronia dyeriana]